MSFSAFFSCIHLSFYFANKISFWKIQTRELVVREEAVVLALCMALLGSRNSPMLSSHTWVVDFGVRGSSG